MKAAISFILMVLALTILTYIFTTNELNVGEKKVSKIHYSKPFLKIKPENVRDTVFTMKDSYLELNLKKQKLYHHFRDGRIFEYLCSTGNPYVEKGMKTNEGIFVLQYKTRRAYSTQFDSTLLLNWMGFNFGIGLHALQSSGYYRYLGKRASSHGCV
ncbi:MAG: L,D-transpeptidase, partial [Ignavibacteria bacterium]|nr:L,D-transpeptidase [Ignavibacteria bacterium]